MDSHFKGRREDRRLLTGTGCFTADWNLASAVYAAFLRSDRAHARIRSIDTSAARALTGVLAVLTGDDLKVAGYKPLPSNAPGPGYQGSPFRLPERHGLAHARPDVTLTQLRYFVKAATYSSMTKAADELHIAQSAVSAAVSQLEQQIGTQLFIRHRARGLALTAAGEEMLRDTRALLAHLDEVLDGASGRVDQVRGTVRLACFVTLTPFVLPRLLSDLGDRAIPISRSR